LCLVYETPRSSLRVSTKTNEEAPRP
jgi:hypothetical protein